MPSKTFAQKLWPDTPLKMGLWATVFAGVLGAITYNVLKNKK